MVADESTSTDSIVAEYRAKFRTYEDFTERCKSLVEQLLHNAGLDAHVLSVTSRTKEIDRVKAKCQRPESTYSALTDITDLAGLRITTFFADEVDKIGSLIEDEFGIDAANSVDKRKALAPDRFGYLSRHFVCSLSEEREDLPEYSPFKGLVLEVQVRTILQHAWAEIEHDLGYKSREAIPAIPRRRFARLAGLLELADDEFIRIREELKVYEAGVSEEIRVDPSKVQIDKASLIAYVSQDEAINRVSASIAAGWDVSEDKTVDSHYVESQIPLLQFLGLNTIEDVAAALRPREKLLVDQARLEAAEDPQYERDEASPRGVALFRLFVVMVAEKGDSQFGVDARQAVGLRGHTREMVDSAIRTTQEALRRSNAGPHARVRLLTPRRQARVVP